MQLPQQLKKWDNQQVRYVIVGGWNTMVGCGVFALLYCLFSSYLHYQVIAALSHCISVFHSWLMYRHFVFHSKAPMIMEYLRFNFSSLFVLGMQMAGLWMLVGHAGLNPLLSQPFIVMLTVLTGYLMHRYFSFKIPQDHESDR